MPIPPAVSRTRVTVSGISSLGCESCNFFRYIISLPVYVMEMAVRYAYSETKVQENGQPQLGIPLKTNFYSLLVREDRDKLREEHNKVITNKDMTQ